MGNYGGDQNLLIGGIHKIRLHKIRVPSFFLFYLLFGGFIGVACGPCNALCKLVCRRLAHPRTKNKTGGETALLWVAR